MPLPAQDPPTSISTSTTSTSTSTSTTVRVPQERLEREYDLDLIVTAPSVVYKVNMDDARTPTYL